MFQTPLPLSEHIRHTWKLCPFRAFGETILKLSKKRVSVARIRDPTEFFLIVSQRAIRTKEKSDYQVSL